MRNLKGEIINSIPSECNLYDPIMNKPLIGVKCSKLGQLYECNNCTIGAIGCLFCGNYVFKTKEKK